MSNTPWTLKTEMSSPRMKIKNEQEEDIVPKKETKINKENIEKTLFDYRCSLCEYISAGSYNMKRHLLVHSGVKPYTCHQCEYSCAAKKDLRRHIYTHTGAKPFLCDQCDYSTTQACTLKRHRFAHNGERPHGCKQCEKSFKEKRDLEAHSYKAHNTGRSFICINCEYTCTRADNLKRHERTHAAKTKPATLHKIYLTTL